MVRKFAVIYTNRRTAIVSEGVATLAPQNVIAASWRILAAWQGVPDKPACVTLQKALEC